MHVCCFDNDDGTIPCDVDSTLRSRHIEIRILRDFLWICGGVALCSVSVFAEEVGTRKYSEHILRRECGILASCVWRCSAQRTHCQRRPCMVSIYYCSCTSAGVHSASCRAPGLVGRRSIDMLQQCPLSTIAPQEPDNYSCILFVELRMRLRGLRYTVCVAELNPVLCFHKGQQRANALGASVPASFRFILFFPLVKRPLARSTYWTLNGVCQLLSVCCTSGAHLLLQFR